MIQKILVIAAASFFCATVTNAQVTNINAMVLIDGKVYPYALIGNQLSIAFDSDNAFLGTLNDYDKDRILLYYGSAYEHIGNETSMVLEKKVNNEIKNDK
jgi:hypothetical protein